MMANANAYVSRGDSLLGTGEWPLARGRTADDQAGRVCVCIVYFVLKETRNKQESCAGEAKSGMEKIRWGFVAAHLLRLVGSGPVGGSGQDSVVVSLGRQHAGLHVNIGQDRELESIGLVGQ